MESDTLAMSYVTKFLLEEYVMLLVTGSDMLRDGKFQ
jgi:hypothetical protein